MTTTPVTPSRPADGVVVVLFGSNEGCSLTRCPIGFAEWFPDRDRAAAYCATVPVDMEPHILRVVEREPGTPTCQSR